ncbi:MAG TPA: DNA/RNA nuclease SfsA [Nitrospirota bacterium]|nr:DNA/RNA nuclease SfsA [Nitrospirota bacterium]
MKFFQNIISAVFRARPNRFIVECTTRGRPVRAYLPNPGKLQELLLPGKKIYLVKQPLLSQRRIEYMVVAVERYGCPILLHTHMNNAVARYLIEHNRIPGLDGAVIVKAEHKMGNSRFDFLLLKGGRDMVLEVKSCTLFGRRIAMFPDAITDRGKKHLIELASLSRRGMDAGVLFLVHAPFPDHFMPDYHTDLEFARTLMSVRDDISVRAVSVVWKKDLLLGSRVRELTIPWKLIEREARDSGSYIIIMRLMRDRKLKIGGLGAVRFEKGFYLYAGSAKKNLTQRIARHRRRRKKLFWHIDYLREYADFCAALPVRTSASLECDLAFALEGISHWTIPGFGSSDCSCDSHLFGMVDDPLHSPRFIEMLQYFRIDRLEKELFNGRNGVLAASG